MTDIRPRLIRNAVEDLRAGQLTWPEAMYAIREGGCVPDPEIFVDAWNWRMAMDMYADPNHDDGDTPWLGNRQAINRQRRENAERQFEAAVARLVPEAVNAA